MKKIAIVFLMMLSINIYASTFSHVNVGIDRLGSHQGQVFYMSLNESFKTDCAGGQLYCPSSNENCKNYYSLVLAAKLADKKLQSIEYTQDVTSKYCSVTLVQIN